MNNNYYRQLLLNLLILITIVLNSIFSVFNGYTFILFLLVITFLALKFIGYEADTMRYKKDIVLKITILTIAYYMIIFAFGLFTGFNRNTLILGIIDTIKNILPLLLAIPLIEMLRYVFITKGQTSKVLIVLSVISLTLLDIMLLNYFYVYTTFDFVFLLLLPSISKNIFISYLTYKVGYKPAIIFNFLLELPIVILPFYPTFGTYVDSVIKFLFPFVVMFSVRRSFLSNDYDKVVSRERNSRIFSKLGYIISFLFLFTIVALTSGLFKYYAVTIATGSMRPNINVGDIVIIEKVKDNFDIVKEGEVLAYHHEGKIIVHRIIKILVVDNVKYIYTKGDNNSASDGYPIMAKDIVGIVKVKIPYVGYPAVELSKLIN